MNVLLILISFVAALTFAADPAENHVVLTDSLAPERVRLIDSHSHDGVNRNFLVRGNIPLSVTYLCDPNQTFDKPGLDAVLKSRIEDAGFVFPSGYFLVDVSLVNPETICPDKHDIDLEKGFVATHSNDSFLWNLILLGDSEGPSSVDPSARLEKAVSLNLWQHDHLPENVARLHLLLQSGPFRSRPIIIYVHCEQGMDRTGQIMGSYSMRYLGQSLQQAVDSNTQIAGRPILGKHRNSLDWYCWYLQASQISDPHCDS